MMHCQKSTKCAACLKEFSSLCEAHYHVSKSIDRRGYLYSVHMSDDGQLLVYSAKGGCSDINIVDHKPKEPKEHGSFYRKGVVACSEILKGQRNSSKSSKDSLGQLKSVVASEDNLKQLKSVVASEDNVEQFKSVVAPEGNLGQLKSVVVSSEGNLGRSISLDTSEGNLGQSKSVVALGETVGQLKSVFACQENSEYTAKNKSKRGPVKLQEEMSEMLDKCVPVDENETEKSLKQSLEPTITTFDVLPTVTSTVRKNAPLQVFVHSSGRISSFDEEISVKESDVAIFSKRKAENSTLKSPSLKCPSDVVKSGPDVVKSAPDIVKSAPGVVKSGTDVVKSAPGVINIAPDVVKKQTVRFGMTRNDKIKAKFKDLDMDASAGKCMSSSSLENEILPQFELADIDECAELGLPHISEDEIRKLVNADVKHLEQVYSISPTCNVTPVFLVENRHHSNIDDNNIDLKDLCKFDQEKMMGHVTNMNKEVSEQLATVRSDDKEAYQQNGANLNRPSLRQIPDGTFDIAGDKSNVSNMLDRLELEFLLKEHSYYMVSKTIGASGVQTQQDERKDLNIYDNFEDSVSIMYENTNNNPSETDLEFPDNVISTHLSVEHCPVIAQPNTSIEQCLNSNGINGTCVSSKGKRDSCSLKASARGRDRLKEIDVKIPPGVEQQICVFSKYGFKMIQRTNFYIECRFCLQTWTRHEILDHIESIHLKHLECRHPKCQQYTSRFQHEIKSLSRYLNNNWSPDSRFVEITLVRGNMYRFCGFSIIPFPELKFLCRSCNKFFCRNDFIKHVTDCHKQHEINFAEEFNDQFEILKKIVPVFKVVGKKKRQKNTTVKNENKVTSNKETKRRRPRQCLITEFRAIKPNLFTTNKAQFLKEFKAYKEQKLEVKRKKQNEFVSCSMCSKRVKASYLKSHVRYAHTIETYPCEVCGGTYPSEKALHKHLQNVHGEEGQFPCTTCGKIYTTKQRLRKHLSQAHRSHTLIPCQLCGKGFKNKNLLNNHMLIHGGTRPFSCHVCKASFKRPDHLKNHIDKVHDVKVLWVCSAPGCESRYKHKPMLEYHIQRHTGKKFLCSCCPQQFTTLKCLNIHMEKSHSVKDTVKERATRAKTKEMDYGFDGTIKLKTILIPEDELKSEPKPYRWTVSEKEIFWNVMDKYLKAGSLAPTSAFKKVEIEIQGTRTLRQIRAKFLEARRLSKQRQKELQREKEIENSEQIKMQAREETDSNEMVKHNDPESISNEDMEYETDENSTVTEEQMDAVDINLMGIV